MRVRTVNGGCGFIRVKYLKRYYQSGNDAYRLKYFITAHEDCEAE